MDFTEDSNYVAVGATTSDPAYFHETSHLYARASDTSGALLLLYEDGIRDPSAVSLLTYWTD